MEPDNEYRNPHENKNSCAYEMISVAHHEAGHVVLSILGLIIPAEARIFTDSDMGGVTKMFHINVPGKPRNEADAFLVNGRLRALLAGLVAEQYYYQYTSGLSLPRRMAAGASMDHRYYRAAVVKNNLARPGAARARLKKEIMEETRALVAQHWDCIRAIAHILIRYRKISYGEITRTILASAKNKRFWKKLIKDLDAVHRQYRKTL